MNFYNTQCCAIQEISGLSNHTTAVDAMKSFCKTNIAAKPKFGGTNSYKGALYSFYMFTAALVGSKQYGSDFAKLIRSENLGEVWESPALTNVAFHPDHKNQVWIWMPDQAAITAWWDKNGGKPAEAKAIAANLAEIDMDALQALAKGYNSDSRKWVVHEYVNHGWVCSSYYGMGHCGQLLVEGELCFFEQLHGADTGNVLCHRHLPKKVVPVVAPPPLVAPAPVVFPTAFPAIFTAGFEMKPPPDVVDNDVDDYDDDYYDDLDEDYEEDWVEEGY